MLQLNVFYKTKIDPPIRMKYPDLPVYSLIVPGGRIYVVTDPDLIQAVDRQPKTFSFGPIVLHFATRFLVASQQSVQKLTAYESNEDGIRQTGLTPETLKIQHDSLAPGKDLDVITQIMIAGILRHLDYSATALDREVGLCAFFKEFVTVISTDAIYGHQKNPYQDHRVIDALWYVYHQHKRTYRDWLYDCDRPLIKTTGKSIRTSACWA